MRTIESLDELLARIVEEDSRKRDLLVDTRRMSVDGTRMLSLDAPQGAEDFHLTDHALGQMATDLNIPKKYFDRMLADAPELFVENVHHWFYNEPKRRLVRGLTAPDNGIVHGRAWLSDRYRRLDNIEVARSLLPEFENLGTQVEFHQAAITEEKLYLRACFPKIEADIKVGDTVRWGVEITNSEVGSGALNIRGFILRLVCTNGMTVAHTFHARHIGKRMDDALSDEAMQADDVAFWLVARDMLRATISETQFEEIVSTLRETTGGPTIERPIKATEVLAQQFSFSDEERDHVLMKLATSGDMSRWGALNAVTAAAQISEGFTRQAEMEEIGWQIAEMPATEWSRIAIAA